MKATSLLVAVLIPVLCFNLADGTVDAGITTRSVEAAGVLKCGLEPLAGAIVYLRREDSKNLEDVIGQATSDANGRFTVSGNTERFGGAQSTIDPTLVIYHKCDKPDKKPFDKITLRFPRTYTSIGKIPRRQYNIGNINVQVKYPGQKEEKALPS